MSLVINAMAIEGGDYCQRGSASKLVISLVLLSGAAFIAHVV